MIISFFNQSGTSSKKLSKEKAKKIALENLTVHELQQVLLKLKSKKSKKSEKSEKSKESSKQSKLGKVS